jgi:two-component system, chemotaxis family, chemotaxis protein CheY
MVARRILVVDDDREVRQALCSVLRDEGYDVSSASDGREAISHLNAGGRPGIILLDMMMPVMGGADFRKVQLGDPQLKDIPVVVLTADGSFREIARSLGAAAAFPKPFELDDLLDTIEQVMGGASPAAVSACVTRPGCFHGACGGEATKPPG